MPKLRTDVVRRILRYHRAGYTVTEIAEAFAPVHRTTISRIINGHTHKRVQADGRLKPLVPVELRNQPAIRPDGSPGSEAERQAALDQAHILEVKALKRKPPRRDFSPTLRSVYIHRDHEEPALPPDPLKRK